MGLILPDMGPNLVCEAIFTTPSAPTSCGVGQIEMTGSTVTGFPLGNLNWSLQKAW